MDESVGCACGVPEDDTGEALMAASVQPVGKDQGEPRSRERIVVIGCGPTSLRVPLERSV